MKPYKKITISFLPSDSDLWEFIEQKKEKQNLSEYIRSLIRRDKSDFMHPKDRDIKQIINILQSQILNSPEEKKLSVTCSNSNQEMIDAINLLF